MSNKDKVDSKTITQNKDGKLHNVFKPSFNNGITQGIINLVFCFNFIKPYCKLNFQRWIKRWRVTCFFYLINKRLVKQFYCLFCRSKISSTKIAGIYNQQRKPLNRCKMKMRLFLFYLKFLPLGNSSSCDTCLTCVFLLSVSKGNPSFSSRGDKVSTGIFSLFDAVRLRNNLDQSSQWLYYNMNYFSFFLQLAFNH